MSLFKGKARSAIASGTIRAVSMNGAARMLQAANAAASGAIATPNVASPTARRTPNNAKEGRNANSQARTA